MAEKPQFNDILFYTTPQGKVKIEVIYENETFWLSQKRISELFGVERSVITKHLKNIFESAELDEKATCAKIAQVQKEGNREVTRDIEFYNTVKMQKRQRPFLRQFKTNYIGQLQVKRRLKSFTQKQMLLKFTWVCRRGKMHPMGKY